MKLLDVLRAEREILERLLELEKEEREAIIYSDIEKLSEIVLKKSDLEKKAREMEEKRVEILKNDERTAAFSEPKLLNIISVYEPEEKEKILKESELLLDKAKQLNKENELNASFLRDQLEYTRFMLDILLIGGKNDFYAKGGKKRAKHEGSFLNMKG